MAGLEGNMSVRQLGPGFSTSTNPVYKIPDHLMAGLGGKEFLIHRKNDDREIAMAVEEATEELFRRTGGAGFLFLCRHFCYPTTWPEERLGEGGGVARAGAKMLVYTDTPEKKGCSEVDVAEWLRKMKNGEEDRVLIVDQHASRGWEASHTLVLDMLGDGNGMDNLIMRTVGFCALVKSSRH